MVRKRHSMKGLQTDTSSPFRVSLTATQIKELDDICSSQNSRCSSPCRSMRKKKKLFDPRFPASVLFLLSTGFIGLLINVFLLKSELYAFVGFLLILPFSWFAFEWQRLYGILLSRELRPILNLASVLATYKGYDPLYQNLYADQKDKIFSCCDGPGINPDVELTADEVSDQAKSPPNSSKST